MKNAEIRKEIEKRRLKYFEVAYALGITESTFSRWLRKELPVDKKEMILKAIQEITL